MKNKKLAIIGSRGYPYIYSGYETFVKEIIERLIAHDFEITVYCHEQLFIEKPKKINGINLVYIPTIETKTLSQFIHSFLSTLHVCFSDIEIILYVNSANGPFGILTKLFRKKTLINVDGLEWCRPKWKGIGAKYFYYSSKIACKLFDVIITDSIEMKKIYLKEFNCDSTVIAYGGNLRESSKPSIIQKFNIEKNKYYLIVGRLIPDNNADLIIKEFINTSTQKKLVVVGDVPYKDTYAENIKNINDERVIFTGYVKDQDLLAELYHNSYAYIHGHEFGGTNPTLLKALAYGCAILALDTRFSREVLDNEKYGVYFCKNNESLYNLINNIDGNSKLINKYKMKSRQRIIENYTWEKITKQYKDLIFNL